MEYAHIARIKEEKIVEYAHIVIVRQIVEYARTKNYVWVINAQ
jgi:hypothetical protein